MSQSLEPGFVLKHQNYQESSLLIDVFMPTSGRISLIAKGVRQQKSQYLGLLRPFLPLNIAYLGKGGLKILSHVETQGREFILPGINTYCGFYLNELIHHFIPIGEPCQDIFLYYLNCLQQLKSRQDNIESALRTFEIQLMQAIGYDLPLEFDYVTGAVISANLKYTFDLEQGAKVDSEGDIRGSTLIAMEQSNYTEQYQLDEAKWLMRQVIDYHLQGKKLQSRFLISKLIHKKSCSNH